jgi:hypothetical protein
MRAGKKMGKADGSLAGMGALRSKLELDRNDEGFTIREYMEKFGLTENQADHELRRMVSSGEVVKGASRRLDERGIKRVINVYRAAK